LSNSVATYFPNPGFTGTDIFTYAAYDGSKNSNLGTGTINVRQGASSISVVAHVPPSYPASWPVAFAAVPTVANSSTAVTFNWKFGDGSADSTNQFPVHTYAALGTYSWMVTANLSGSLATASGVIVIGKPINLTLARSVNGVSMSWPDSIADCIVERSTTLGPNAVWIPVTNGTYTASSLEIPSATDQEFFRSRRAW